MSRNVLFSKDLLIHNLKDLRNGKPVEVPTYDYSQHTRSKETIVRPRSLVSLVSLRKIRKSASVST
jgi:uridine kinase